MALGTNYRRIGSKESKSIIANLKKHKILTDKFIDQGYSKEEAGKLAYNQIVNPKKG